VCIKKDKRFASFARGYRFASTTGSDSGVLLAALGALERDASMVNKRAGVGSAEDQDSVHITSSVASVTCVRLRNEMNKNNKKIACAMK
jgi:hypothetical protein